MCLQERQLLLLLLHQLWRQQVQLHELLAALYLPEVVVVHHVVQPVRKALQVVIIHLRSGGASGGGEEEGVDKENGVEWWPGVCQVCVRVDV